MGLKLTWRDPVWYVTGTVVDPTGEKIRVRKSTGFGKNEKQFAMDAMRRLLIEVMSGKLGKATGEAETLADVWAGVRMMTSARMLTNELGEGAR